MRTPHSTPHTPTVKVSRLWVPCLRGRPSSHFRSRACKSWPICDRGGMRPRAALNNGNTHHGLSLTLYSPDGLFFGFLSPWWLTLGSWPPCLLPVFLVCWPASRLSCACSSLFLALEVWGGTHEYWVLHGSLLVQPLTRNSKSLRSRLAPAHSPCHNSPAPSRPTLPLHGSRRPTPHLALQALELTLASFHATHSPCPFLPDSFPAVTIWGHVTQPLTWHSRPFHKR